MTQKTTMKHSVYIHPLLDLDAAVCSLMEALEVPILAVSRDGEVLMYNGGMERLTGYTRQEFSGTNCTETLYPDPEDRHAVEAHLRQVFMGEPVGESRWALTRKDGSRRTVICRPIPLRDGDGRIVAVFTALPDLTESDAPIASKLRPENPDPDMEEELTGLVFRIDSKTGRLQFVSRSSKPLLGYAPKDFYRDQRLFTSRVNPEYDEPLESAIRSAAHGTARSIEVGFVHREGHEVIMSVMLYPVKDHKGNVITIEGLCRDITSRKATEWRLEQSLWDLQAAYEQLQAQHEALQSLDRLKSHILANVSHELRTPLVTIMGYNELMRQGALGRVTEAQLRGLEIASRSITRLMNLIENLLDFARLERDRLRLPDALVDLTEVMDELVGEMKPELDRKNLELDYVAFDSKTNVTGDRKRLIQVFRNLLDNAIKFSSEDGFVALRCMRTSEEEVTVEVEDRGVGIPEEEQERIFDSFYQVDGSSTRMYPGVGIGLAVSRQLVELHGGSILVKSEPAKGSCFKVSLPVAGDAQGSVNGTPIRT